MNNQLFFLLDLVFLILSFFTLIYAAVQLSIADNCDDNVVLPAPNCDYDKANDSMIFIATVVSVAAFFLGFCLALAFLLSFGAMLTSVVVTIAFMVAYSTSDNSKATNQDGKNLVYSEQLLLLGVEVTLLVLGMVLFCERKRDLGGVCFKKNGCKGICSN